ncbi:MAG: uroporphyrinogen decarboxylase family protein [Eubacteriales bacterium]
MGVIDMESAVDVKELKKFRHKLYSDLYSGIIPERIPVEDGLQIEYLIQYAGKDLMTTQYSYSSDLIIELFEKIMEIARGDKISAGFARNPIGMMFQQSLGFEMSTNGMIQHPERSFMKPDEYDEFISNPYNFIIEKISKRSNKGYDKGEVLRSMNFGKYLLSKRDTNTAFAIADKVINEKYGFFEYPSGSVGMQPVPFDFIADFNRGFANAVVDMKRYPEKFLEAIEAVMPYLIFVGKTPVQDPLGCDMIMTHMATFLNRKDFEKYYWPTFHKICHICAERGQAMQIFCEDDWTRYLDELSDLPQGTRLFMEYGDPQKFKDKLGKKMILGGFYPLTLLKMGTQQQCIDKAKELLDILAPGGNYFFRFDKGALNLSDINTDNYVAVMEYVLENGKYTNAGQPVTADKKEDSIIKYSHLYPEFKSKYIISFDDFKKEYPPVDERIEPLMRAAYDKYTAEVIRMF